MNHKISHSVLLSIKHYREQWVRIEEAGCSSLLVGKQVVAGTPINNHKNYLPLQHC